MTTTRLPSHARIIAAALLLAATLSACNTMAGVGQDTKDAGQSLENSADRNK